MGWPRGVLPKNNTPSTGGGRAFRFRAAVPQSRKASTQTLVQRSPQPRHGTVALNYRALPAVLKHLSCFTRVPQCSSRWLFVVGGALVWVPCLIIVTSSGFGPLPHGCRLHPCVFPMGFFLYEAQFNCTKISSFAERFLSWAVHGICCPLVCLLWHSGNLLGTGLLALARGCWKCTWIVLGWLLLLLLGNPLLFAVVGLPVQCHGPFTLQPACPGGCVGWEHHSSPSPAERH